MGFMFRFLCPYLTPRVKIVNNIRPSYNTTSMALQLFNTLSRQKEEFIPLQKNEVGLYTCGPTVYAAAHLGNLRTYIFEDVLKRTLLAHGYKVKHVMNITDVGHLTSDADEGEDKMETGALREHKNVWQLAEYYTQQFKQDLHALNILEPDIWCRATEHISEQIALIQTLEKKGLTYRTGDGIYFDTAKLQDYGKLARLDLKGLREGARVEANPEKHNPTDFALWKFSPTGAKRQMEWDSPWGTGFPGWHIECSAMSMKYLGDTFDIHTGGIDHIPVHHTNEIAQSEGATGKPFVKYWLHGEFLITADKRMGKSEGNFLTLTTLSEQKISPLAYRYFCLGAHYRSKLNFSIAAVESAQIALHNLQDKIATMGEARGSCPELEQKFMAAIDDDLNTPQALAALWELMKSNQPDAAKKNTLIKFDTVLGLGFNRIQPLVVPPEVAELVAEREQARQTKAWEKADALRKLITQRQFTVDDTELGPVIRQLR